jgi:phosphohistidine swiveling domain-containing protein
MADINIKKENKNNYEISRFDGRIFCCNHFFFSSVAIPQKFFNFYLPTTPNNYWLGACLKSSFKAGSRLYQKYIGRSDLLKQKFYQQRDYCRVCFDKLTSKDKVDSKYYRSFIKSVTAFGQIASFNLEGLENILEKKVSNLTLASNLKDIITFPLYIPYCQKQNESLIKIIKSLDSSEIRLLARKNNNISSYKKLLVLLEKHLTKWGWSLTNYNSEHLPTLKEFLELTIKAYFNLDKEEATIKENRYSRKQKKKIVLDLSAEIKNIIKLLDTIFELKDQRKAFWLNISLDLKAWFRKISPSYLLSADDLMWLTWEEHCQLKENKKEYFLKIIEARKNNCVTLYGYNGERATIITGRKAEKIINFFLQQKRRPELRGITACSGKVIGKIRNINSSQDFGTFSKGEILSASHTAPDYLPIMKKAKAILTERGGITSHAAIISRELKVPCIVGIRGLFNNFSDGDTVEVNADQGTVKFISN